IAFRISGEDFAASNSCEAANPAETSRAIVLPAAPSSPNPEVAASTATFPPDAMLPATSPAAVAIGCLRCSSGVIAADGAIGLSLITPNERLRVSFASEGNCFTPPIENNALHASGEVAGACRSANAASLRSSGPADSHCARLLSGLKNSPRECARGDSTTVLLIRSQTDGCAGDGMGRAGVTGITSDRDATLRCSVWG